MYAKIYGMHTTGIGTDRWDLMNRGTDSETGLPMCHVRRITFGVLRDNATVWKLVQRPNGWYNVGQFVYGVNGFRPTPEKNGVKLSGSRIDLTLRSFAETGHGNAYA